jgi:holo-[acyl-carrier protein] synthase
MKHGYLRSRATGTKGETMSLVGVGADILRIDRMRRCLDSDAFVERTFTRRELKGARVRADAETYLAKVFSGKEAVFKCLGIHPDDLGSWTDIEVVDGEHGRPRVRLGGALAGMGEALGWGEIDLALSYDTDYVVAFAALRGRSSDGR